MKIDLDKLEVLAQAATPGPWTARGFGFRSAEREIGFCHGFQDGTEDQREAGLADAAHIAAASPDVVLALIDELGLARQKLAQYKLALEAAADEIGCPLCGNPSDEHDEGCDLHTEDSGG